MKKNITNETEGVKIKIKALDVVIILLILAALFGVYFKYNKLDTLIANKNSVEFTVSFEIKNIRSTTEQYIQPDHKVFYDDGTELGTLIEAADRSDNVLIRVPTQITYFPENSTQAIPLSYPDNTRIDAKGRMLCKGSVSEDGYCLINGNKQLAPGDKLSVRTELVSFEITITEIITEKK